MRKNYYRWQPRFYVDKLRVVFAACIAFYLITVVAFDNAGSTLNNLTQDLTLTSYRHSDAHPVVDVPKE